LGRLATAFGQAARELRELPPRGTFASEAGWQQGFDLMAAASVKPTESGGAPDGGGS
jgi:hypothetical protein